MQTTRTTKCDLWNTSLRDICITDKKIRRNDVSICFSCLRPILKRSVSTRVFQSSNKCAVDILLCSQIDSESDTEARAVQKLQLTKKQYYVCHICIPSFKKCIREIESLQPIHYPTSFILKSIDFMSNTDELEENKLGLLKAITCLVSEIKCDSDTYQHCLRKKENDNVELILLVFRRILKKTKWNFAAAREHMCPFELVAFARWHAAGFPDILNHSKIWRCIRRCFTGITAELYFSTIPEAKAMYSQMKNSPLCVCALCLDAKIQDKAKKNGYDDVLADTRLHHLAPRSGISKKKCIGSTILCTSRSRVVVRSWLYYQYYSKNFPKTYQEESPWRFYRMCIARHNRKQNG